MVLLSQTAASASGLQFTCGSLLFKKCASSSSNRRFLLENLAKTFSTETDKSSSRAVHTFQHKDLVIKPLNRAALKQKPDWENLRFGASFSDHMLEVVWSNNGGWEKPRIVPLHDLVLHPAAKVLHYAVELFEGLKAYRGIDNEIRLFRPDLNMDRMLSSARRSCLPDFDKEELLKCIMELVRLEQEWVPYSSVSSLYIRPTIIGIDPTLGVAQSNVNLLYVIVGPVGAYFPTGFKPVGLYADPEFSRSWQGGSGQYKLGSNYGPTIFPHKKAQDLGCQQVLWLHDNNDEITEVGTMNLFLYWTNEKGEEELITPPLDSGLILPGVTRRTILELAKEWNEFKVSEKTITMGEVIRALKENRVKQIFGAGTACVVCPVNRILFKKHGRLTDYHIPTMEYQPSLLQRFWDHITGIQYGIIPRPSWTRIVPSKIDDKMFIDENEHKENIINEIGLNNGVTVEDAQATAFKVITA